LDIAIDEPRSCPELEAIEWRCRAVDNLAGDTSRMLYVPCVKLQICKACVRLYKLPTLTFLFTFMYSEIFDNSEIKSKLI